MKKIKYFIVAAFISVFMILPTSVFAASGGTSFEADTTIKPKPEEKPEYQNLSEEQRDLNRLKSEKSAITEYEAQQARLDAELEKRKAQEAQKIKMSQVQNFEQEQRPPVERAKTSQELEKRKTELERKIRELEERKAVVREKKTQLETQMEKQKFKPQPFEGEEITQIPVKQYGGNSVNATDAEISDAELEAKATESEERRMNILLLKLTVSEDFFVKDGYEFTQSAKNEIKKYAEQIKKLNYRKITVEGHSDSFEAPQQAKKSSRLRAKSVYDELIKNGISADKAQYVGLADKIREETNKTKKGRLANRRTEIFVE